MKTRPARKPSRLPTISILWPTWGPIRSRFIGKCFFCLFIIFFNALPQAYGGADKIPSSAHWPTCKTNTASQKISFVHVSDTHAAYNPTPGGTSPLARIKGFAEQVKRETPYTIFTNAGDDYEKGSIAEQISQGVTTRQVVQAMQYDVRTIGNHDFAWGLEELLAFSHDQVAVVLASNTKMTANASDQEPGWVDYKELTVGCLKIGFFGLVSKPWTENGEQYDGPFYQEHPELQSNFNHLAIAREIIASHRHEVDLLVLVSHLGIFDDVLVAEETEGIDIILGGHTHTTMTEPQQVKNTTIIHTGSHAENIGRLDLDYNLRDRQITASHFTLVPNQEDSVPADDATNRKISKIISPYQKEIHADFARINSNQSKKEMALIAAWAAVKTLGSDAAFVNPQSAWRKRPAGRLTPQDILDTFPVEREPAGEPGLSSLYLIKGTGADLLQARTSLPDFAYWGPADIDPTAIYTIALPKAQALNQHRYFGRQIDLEPPDPAGEIWKAVVEFGRRQNDANLALDERVQDRRGDLIAALPQNR